MADEVIQDDHPEIKPAPVPKPEREPVTIEGEAVDLTPPSSDVKSDDPLAAVEAETAARETASEPLEPEADLADGGSKPPPTDVPPRVDRSDAGRPSYTVAFVAGGLGALVGAAVAIGVSYVYQPGSSNLESLTGRVGALDTAMSGEASARKSLDARVADIEAKTGKPVASAELAALQARLSKLEGSAVTADALASVASASKAAQTTADKAVAMVAGMGTSGGSTSASAPNPEVMKLIGDQQNLGDRLAKLESQLAAAQAAPPKGSGAQADQLASAQQALAERIAKLEASAKSAKDEPPASDPEVGKLVADDKALTDRIAKVEAALAAPKTETRADPSVAVKGDPIGQSVAAIALERRLFDGQPYAVELSALEKLGADAQALSALKPYAQTGAPTAAVLAAGFAKLAPSLRASSKTAEHGDYAETLWDEVKGLVKVHPVGETKGDDPAAVVTQISAALGRGDLAAARTAFAKLPEEARASAAAWAKDLDAAAAARAVALSLIETSLSRIAEQKN